MKSDVEKQRRLGYRQNRLEFLSGLEAPTVGQLGLAIAERQQFHLLDGDLVEPRQTLSLRHTLANEQVIEVFQIGDQSLNSTSCR